MEGSLSPSTLFYLAERNGRELPFSSPRELLANNVYQDFAQFANMLLLHSSVIEKPKDFALVVYQLGKALQRDNIRYAEVIWAPQLHLRKGLSINEIFAAMCWGKDRVKEEFDIEIRWIVDLVRRFPDVSEKIQRWACSDSSRRAGVVALGLGGPEIGRSVKPFVPIFAEANRLGLPACPHAGEDGNAQHIWDAIHLLGANRIGHGTRAIEDPDLLRYLADEQLPLEVCLSSNVQTSITHSYSTHPLRTFLDAGCFVTLNSDDPGIFHTTLSQEYQHAVESCAVTEHELCEIALNGVRASHLDDDSKSDMLSRFRSEIDGALSLYLA